jgi:hypothetical protein
VPPGSRRDRALALAGLAGLFVVAAVCVSLVLGAGSSDEPAAGGTAAATATQTPTATPSPTPTPKPTPPPLTAEQRAQRSAAADQVRAQGFDPVSLRAYHPDQTLRVLLGEPTDAALAAGARAGRRAFFFVGDSFVRTDAEEVSAELRIVKQTERTVTLRYGLIDGQNATVRFKWDGTALTPQTVVPLAEQRQGPA